MLNSRLPTKPTPEHILKESHSLKGRKKELRNFFKCKIILNFNISYKYCPIPIPNIYPFY